MFSYESLTLRKLDKKDLKLLSELKQESWFGTHHVTIVNDTDQERWFERLDNHPHHPGNLFLIAEADYLPIGLFKITSIDWVNRQADAAWDIFKQYRGKGMGKDLVTAGTHFAFEILNLHRLNAEILETNEASQKCALAAGYVKEGCKKQAIFKNDHYVDSWMFGCLTDSIFEAGRGDAAVRIFEAGRGDAAVRRN